MTSFQEVCTLFVSMGVVCLIDSVIASIIELLSAVVVNKTSYIMI